MEMIYLGRYTLEFDATTFKVLCPLKKEKFSGLATSALPKLYVISAEGYQYPVYVGMTKQSMGNRLRMGWKADGKNGYHGYAWRRHFATAAMDIWCHTDSIEGNCIDVETVEAEMVHLIRQAGQWPAFQTEIHFHESTAEHRKVAGEIGARYGLGPEVNQEKAEESSSHNRNCRNSAELIKGWKSHETLQIYDRQARL